MSYLRNCWYAAAWAVDLKPGTITARTLLDEPLVFYRDAQGAAVAMDDMCPHRLAPLRMAKLLPTGNLQCSYHGLEFDGKGQCVKNPHGQGRIPSKCQIRTYPLVEKHSMVWIWMDQPPPTKASSLSSATSTPAPATTWADATRCRWRPTTATSLTT